VITDEVINEVGVRPDLPTARRTVAAGRAAPASIVVRPMSASSPATRSGFCFRNTPTLIVLSSPWAIFRVAVPSSDCARTSAIARVISTFPQPTADRAATGPARTEPRPVIERGPALVDHVELVPIRLPIHHAREPAGSRREHQPQRLAVGEQLGQVQDQARRAFPVQVHGGGTVADPTQVVPDQHRDGIEQRAAPLGAASCRPVMLRTVMVPALMN